MNYLLTLLALGVLASCSHSTQFTSYRERAYVCKEGQRIKECRKTYEHVDNSIFFRNSERELNAIRIPK